MSKKRLFVLLAVIGFSIGAVFTIKSPASANPKPEPSTIIIDDGLPGTRFLHVATTDNIIGSSTYIDHPLTNGDPNATIFVTKNSDAGLPVGGGVLNEHRIGVWFDALEGKWAIFNEDGSNIAAGSYYNVLIPDVGTGVFTHQATVSNIDGHWTYVTHPFTDGNPDAVLFVTQNWNPGGSGGTYNDHPIGVWYDNGEEKWAIFNEDSAAMPEDAAFNVLVPVDEKYVFVHYATSENIDTSTSTSIERPDLDEDNHALLFVTQNWNPGGTGSTYNPYSVDVSFNGVYGHWTIGNQEPGMSAPMTEGAAFNVLYITQPEPFYVHKATAGNSSGNSTFLDNQLLNEEPNMVTIITQNWNPGSPGGVYNDHPPGVFYSNTYDQWLIFNEDGSVMPQGASFNVLIPNLDTGAFVHNATTDSISNNSTFITHPWTDGDSGAVIFVTQNWNPGGVGGVYNDHPIGVWYNDLNDEWAVFNEDEVNMPTDASFNIYIPPASSNVFVHTATPGNSLGNSTYLDHPLLNGQPAAKLLVTQNWNPGGGLSGTYNPHVIGVWYDNADEEWLIFNQDGASMPSGAAFNVLVQPGDVYLPLIMKN
ncbi:MAG: hypothetical protein PVF85_07285 [Anaerolineales bacterium]|jgi:hypothetical protein